MTDRPIIFSAPMVRALLDGRKTQTRRLATSPLRRCEAGDRLWVKETWARDDLIDTGARYYATDTVNSLRKKRASIYMPRWASRLTLIVEAVRVEPLQAISEADAEAEGCVWDSADGFDVWYVPGARLPRHGETAAAAYRELWQMLHGAESWDANPNVVAITFRVVRGNIDRSAP